jgi:hypothetical protein
MPVPLTPRLKATLTGRDKHDPKRFIGRSDPKTVPLGGPSSWIKGKQYVAWQMFRDELPWLRESDRTIVEIASEIRGRMMDGEPVAYQALTLLRQCLGQMGATPADRAKVVNPDEPAAEPTDTYFN